MARASGAQLTTPKLLNPRIPADLTAIILQAMSMNPEDRFQTMHALGIALGTVKLPEEPELAVAPQSVTAVQSNISPSASDQMANMPGSTKDAQAKEDDTTAEHKVTNETPVSLAGSRPQTPPSALPPQPPPIPPAFSAPPAGSSYQPSKKAPRPKRVNTSVYIFIALGAVGLIAIAVILGLFFSKKTTAAVLPTPTIYQFMVEPTRSPTRLEATKEPPKTAAPITLEIWHTYTAGSLDEQALIEVIHNLEKKYSNVSVQTSYIDPDNFRNQLATTIAAGVSPDLVLASQYLLSSLNVDGLLLDLTSFNNLELDKYFASSISEFTKDGKIFAVPESADTLVLFYNSRQVSKPPFNTDELLQEVSSGKKISMIVNPYYFFPWVGSYGGQLYDEKGHCIADQGGWSEAAQFLTNLQAANGGIEIDSSLALDSFQSGQSAFLVDGNWDLASLSNALGSDLAAVPLPKANKMSAPFVQYDGFAVVASSKHLQEAEIVLKYLTSKDAAQIYMNSAYHIPVRSDVGATDPKISAFTVAVKNGVLFPDSTYATNFFTVFDGFWNAILNNGGNPASEVQTACQQLNQLNGK